MRSQEELHQALATLVQLIERDPGTAKEGPTVSDQLRRIDQLREDLGPEGPPMLRHYIEKRSYAKAIDFLEGRDEASATPNC